MNWECNKITDVATRQLCKNMATAYYQAVSVKGITDYNNAQQGGCGCTP